MERGERAIERDGFLYNILVRVGHFWRFDGMRRRAWIWVYVSVFLGMTGIVGYCLV
ncbi:hypothetical protein P154DRAFT_522399 [Amniculicola lignicola CBS 123094]|uniref:Uncharacterized protein n=1 Tax=Amniculicola lignicola CBS 123094 TaxID=1392246 RepID=A0A6A5WHG8_9PLEO|nr:hypothetical protein P154DRAFT_522399 [Amniculicola lignicola CBS 123094]